MDVRSYEAGKIRNERIRGTTKMGEITKKVHERRLKWYGHVMRREEHYLGRSNESTGRTKRGRPKREREGGGREGERERDREISRERGRERGVIMYSNRE